MMHLVNKDTIVIREIIAEDDIQVAKAIRSVLIEFGVPKVGTAYEDTALDCMTETFIKPTSTYFVVDDNGKIIGGAGVAQLDHYEGNVCELQKMYFLPEARGKGLGSKMMNACLQKAKILGFEKCYLETMPYMESARRLYAKEGFQSIDKPMGDTGHYSCQLWMIKNL